MTALAIAISYVASLAFAGYLLWRRDRYRTDVAEKLTHLANWTVRIEGKAMKWDHAAQWVEARELERGLTGRASRG